MFIPKAAVDITFYILQPALLVLVLLSAPSLFKRGFRVEGTLAAAGAVFLLLNHFFLRFQPDFRFASTGMRLEFYSLEGLVVFLALESFSALGVICWSAAFLYLLRRLSRQHSL